MKESIYSLHSPPEPVTKQEVFEETHKRTEHAQVDPPTKVSNLEQEETRASWWKRQENSPLHIFILLVVLALGLITLGLVFNKWHPFANKEISKPAAAIKTNEPAAPSPTTPIVSTINKYCGTIDIPQNYTVSTAAYEMYGNGRRLAFTALTEYVKAGPKDGNGPVGIANPRKWPAFTKWSFPCELHLADGRTLEYQGARFARFAKKRDIATAQSEISASSNAALITPVQAANADVPSPETYAQATQPQTATLQEGTLPTTPGFGPVPEAALVHEGEPDWAPLTRQIKAMKPESFGFNGTGSLDSWAEMQAKNYVSQTGLADDDTNRVIRFDPNSTALVLVNEHGVIQIDEYFQEGSTFKPKRVLRTDAANKFLADRKEGLYPFEHVVINNQ